MHSHQLGGLLRKSDFSVVVIQCSTCRSVSQVKKTLHSAHSTCAASHKTTTHGLHNKLNRDEGASPIGLSVHGCYLSWRYTRPYHHSVCLVNNSSRVHYAPVLTLKGISFCENGTNYRSGTSKETSKAPKVYGMTRWTCRPWMLRSLRKRTCSLKRNWKDVQVGLYIGLPHQKSGMYLQVCLCDQC